MINFKKYKLSDACLKIGSGATPRGGKDAYHDSGEYSLVRSQNILDFTFSRDGLAFISEEQASKLNNVTLEERDVLLNITGDSVARVCQIPKEILPARVNQHVAILRPNPNILNPEFLKYYLLNPKFKEFMLMLSSSGATRNAITKGMIEEFEIDAPDIPTQKAIAEILSSLDDKIELNNQINQNLEALAQALFKQWFVDFEFPNENGEPYKSSGGEMVDSELSEIPKGWGTTKLGLIGRVITGKTPANKNPHHFGSFIPFVTPSDFKSYFKLIISSDRGLSSEGKKAFSKSVLPKNSVIVTCIGSDMGKVAVNREECVTNQQINSIAFNSDSKITSELTYYFLKSIYSELKNLATGGSTMPIINKTQFENIDIINPETKLVLTFSSQILNFDHIIEKNVRENENLKSLRDTLLPKLISGELEVLGIEDLSTALGLQG